MKKFRRTFSLERLLSLPCILFSFFPSFILYYQESLHEKETFFIWRGHLTLVTVPHLKLLIVSTVTILWSLTQRIMGSGEQQAAGADGITGNKDTILMQILLQKEGKENIFNANTPLVKPYDQEVKGTKVRSFSIRVSTATLNLSVLLHFSWLF